ncbi:MAG: alpha/beta hydrolase [bacterium]
MNIELWRRGAAMPVVRASGMGGRWLGLVMAAVMLAAIAAVPGCRHSMIPTPNLMLTEQGRRIMAEVPQARQKTEMRMLYFTDRQPRPTAAAGEHDAGEQTGPGCIEGYTADRSDRLRWGVVSVTTAPVIGYEELLEDSLRVERDREFILKVSGVEPGGDLSFGTTDLVIADGRYVRSPEQEAVIEASQADLNAQLAEWMAQTDRRDVYLFVHGFNNSFEDSVIRPAGTWHFLGRVGVAACYSWPAGYGGLFGYAYDRESGEYTVFHLKRAIKALARSPHVDRIHIIAHSRGADVATSALRELVIEYAAAELDLRESLKIQTLVLAAPDLDTGVFKQRVLSEGVLAAVGRLVVYFSPEDAALSFAAWLFSAGRRLGAMSLDEFTDQTGERLAAVPNIEFVASLVRTPWSANHDYVFAHSAAMSDLILLLRDGAKPNEGRPLGERYRGVWRLTDGYMLPGARPLQPAGSGSGSAGVDDWFVP